MTQLNLLRVRKTLMLFVLLLFIFSLSGNSLMTANELESEPYAITNIIAAGYAQDSQELIVIGKNEESWNGVSRAYFHENILLTLRAIYDNPIEWPGVTIEFEPFPGEPPVPEDHLPVYNFGKTDDTHHGNVTFEADRLLKAYSLGVDNVTVDEMSSNVDCYVSVLKKHVELQKLNYQAGPTDPQRFWLTPEVTIKMTPEKDAIEIIESRMLLQWEYIPANSPNTTPNASASADHFVDCFNNNYDQFAAEQSALGNDSLYELEILGEIAIIADWIKENSLDTYSEKLQGIHYPWLDLYAKYFVPFESTVDSTPAITVSEEYTIGDTVFTQSIFGGVTLNPILSVVNNSNAKDLVSKALAARPSPLHQEWLLNEPRCNSSSRILDVNSFERVPACSVIVEKGSIEHIIDGYFATLDGWKLQTNNQSHPPIEFEGVLALAGANNIEHSVSKEIILQNNLDSSVQFARGLVQPIMLSLDWQIASPNDPNSNSVDFLHIKLYDKNGDLIANLETVSNAHPEKLTWIRRNYDVSDVLAPYLGGKITVAFEASNNGNNPTYFVIDNVLLDTIVPPFDSISVGDISFVYIPMVTSQDQLTQSFEQRPFLHIEARTPTISSSQLNKWPLSTTSGSRIKFTIQHE